MAETVALEQRSQETLPARERVAVKMRLSKVKHLAMLLIVAKESLSMDIFFVMSKILVR